MRTFKPSSPIELVGSQPSEAPPLDLDGWAVGFRIAHTGLTLSLTPEAGCGLCVGAERWELNEVHVHHPSEHTLPSVDARAELHLVHRNRNDDILVIGVLVTQSDSLHPGVAEFLASAPAAHEEVFGDGRFAPYDLLPAQQESLRYVGSLTTPPFAPGVRWVCMTTPIGASQAQIEQITSAFPTNACPQSPLGDRPLLRCR